MAPVKNLSRCRNKLVGEANFMPLYEKEHNDIINTYYYHKLHKEILYAC